MFKKWFPWKWIIRKLALGRGFLDPIEVISKLQRFAQPSEVAAPVELIRLATILQARGLLNAQAIQHNLDWVWPYWVEKQFDPHDISFIPRAFSVTHINLTHRNWTAVGVPGDKEYAIVDPRGLFTPMYDGWSIDAWVIDATGNDVLPSKSCDEVTQKLITDNNLKVQTMSKNDSNVLISTVQSFGREKSEVAQMNLKVSSKETAWLAVSIRPYNPEGVSSVNKIQINENLNEWTVNQNKKIIFDQVPQTAYLSDYREGDVYRKIKECKKDKKFPACDQFKIKCDVGMASGVALFPIEKDIDLNVYIPLRNKEETLDLDSLKKASVTLWDSRLLSSAKLDIGDKKYQYLFDSALHSMILHAPKGEVYPGPYTYRHFWFRDAAIIMNAMLAVGFTDKVEEIIDAFSERQTVTGHYRSQDGEWDSNGQVLWIVKRYCQVTNKKPKEEWKHSLQKGARWICKKRLTHEKGTLHDGLYPPGFSAEHLGPNDYYYWDDFWGVEGLCSAAYLLKAYGETQEAKKYEDEAKQFLKDIENSLAKVEIRLRDKAMPSSPYRRLDSASIGSIVVGYPLQLWSAEDERLIETSNFLMSKFLVHNGFFHDMSHSGINPYLTLYLAQIYLRAGDERYFSLMQSIADLASGTGQWPEAINPRTLGGCMGDGQHIWATAEWILMLKNCFVLEEEDSLILLRGLNANWFEEGRAINFGPIYTKFGRIALRCDKTGKELRLSWSSEWHSEEPAIEVIAPGYEKVLVEQGIHEVLIKEK